MTLAEKIKTYRKIRNLSQDILADKTGVSQGMISQWENGASEPTATYLKKLAIALDIPTDFLVGLTTDDIPYWTNDNENSNAININEQNLILNLRTLTDETQHFIKSFISEQSALRKVHTQSKEKTPFPKTYTAPAAAKNTRSGDKPITSIEITEEQKATLLDAYKKRFGDKNNE